MNLTVAASRAAATVVAAVAGYSSWRHIVDVAERAGEHADVASVLPLSVDGLVVVGTTAMLVDKKAGRTPRWSARVAVGFGIGTTLLFNRYIARVSAMDRPFRVTPATLDILEVLVDGEEDLHGFTIAQHAGRPTGSTYPILARLEHAGWLNSYWETQNPQEGLPRRRFYRLEPDGLRAARTLLLERRGKQPGGPRSSPPRGA